MVGERRIDALDADEKRKLNQITGNAYLNLFAFVEEFILARPNTPPIATPS